MAQIIKWKLSAKKKLTLKDINDWQPLDLGEYNEVDEWYYKKLDSYELQESNTFLAVQILSVYPGTKYKDTLISEISN